jgi:hypothetical protein
MRPIDFCRPPWVSVTAVLAGTLIPLSLDEVAEQLQLAQMERFMPVKSFKVVHYRLAPSIVFHLHLQIIQAGASQSVLQAVHGFIQILDELT